jgi:heme/copper-type cytochrome/quinol oxidase subunit 3
VQPLLIVQLLAMDARPDWKAMQEVLWHFITAFLAATACALGFTAMSRRNQTSMLIFIVSLQLAFAALFMAYGTSRLGHALALPQWIAFLVVAVLIAVHLAMAKTNET